MTLTQGKTTVTSDEIYKAHGVLKDVITKTPLEKNKILSEKYGCNLYLKREDLQVVRSFKIRGAYHFIKNLTKGESKNGIVCASAGNHAQGVAFSCKKLKIKGKVFMPVTTPRQKVSKVKFFGGEFVDVVLTGDTFDDAFGEAMSYGVQQKMTFVHPFDDPGIIAGQGTVGLEIMEDIDDPVDYLFAAIGGGGLTSGVGTYVKSVSPETKMVGAEPMGAPGMKNSLAENHLVTLEHIDKFVDGASVKQVGQSTMEICKKVLDDIVLVPEGKVCTSILDLYNENAIVAEPAGALPIAALDLYQEQIEGKTVVCIISGGNNDIDRMQEIKERSLVYEGLQRYFIIHFPQRPGALREFINEVLGSDDDITRFEYMKKNNREKGPTLVGIELQSIEDYEPLMARMNQNGIQYTEINKDPELFQLLV